MTISDTLKRSAYAVVFGFMGLIMGIWLADLLYSLVLKNLERVTTIYISLILILLVIGTASLFGFFKAKNLLE